MNIRQGVVGGLVIALFASLGVGNAAESFWGGFLTALAFSLLMVGATAAVMVRANHGRTSR